MTTKMKQQEKHKMSEIDDNISRVFDIRKRLGKGAYGIVWKAIDKRSNETVAVKKIFDAFRDETDAQRTFREITFLKAFRNHPNIVTLLTVFKATNNLDMYLIFEYMESDLHNIIKKGTILKDIHKRYVMYQLVNAIKYIHSGNVIHRDLKPSNILIDSKCRVKLADFGLARSVSNNPTMEMDNDPVVDPLLTDYVATRWYRAPEILVASKRYTKGIDMWSLGCILGEMLRGKPLFQGSSTINQIEKIITALPEITEHDVNAVGAGFGSVLLSKQISTERKTSIPEILYNSPADAVNLVESLLLLDPLSRLTAKQALNHIYIEKFRNSISEEELNFDVLPAFRDDVRLTVAEYRSKLYEIVSLPTDKPNYRDTILKANRVGKISPDSKLIINWEKSEATKKSQKNHTHVSRTRTSGDGQVIVKEKHISHNEKVMTELPNVSNKTSKTNKKHCTSPTSKRKGTKASKVNPTPEIKVKDKLEDKVHVHSRTKTHSMSVDSFKDRSAKGIFEKRYSVDNVVRREEDHSQNRLNKSITGNNEQISPAGYVEPRIDMKGIKRLNGEVQNSCPSPSIIMNASSNLRNTKSEQLPKHKSSHTMSGQASIPISSNNFKPQDRICYEERLKKLEAEIEKYKQEVKSFCQQTSICKENKHKSDITLQQNRHIDNSRHKNLSIPYHNSLDHDSYHMKNSKSKRIVHMMDRLPQNSGGSGDHISNSPLKDSSGYGPLDMFNDGKYPQKSLKTHSDYTNQQRIKQMGKYF